MGVRAFPVRQPVVIEHAHWCICGFTRTGVRLNGGRPATNPTSRTLIDKEEVDRQDDLPLSSRFPLAQLEIARIYARKGDSAKARAQYRQFFDLWKGADSDAPLLVAAQRDAALLP
jgi:hypothetical protein